VNAQAPSLRLIARCAEIQVVIAKDRHVLCYPGTGSHKFTENFVATSRKLD
jgi:hypothetical protein